MTVSSSRHTAGSLRSAFPQTALIFWTLVLVSGGFIAATALYYLDVIDGTAHRVLILLSLSMENNLGAWWSGMLLAVVAFAAFAGYHQHRRRHPRVAEGWAWLAGMLLFLSFDEVGSIHERLGTLGQSLGPGAWLLLAPLGGVLGVATLRALWLLRSGNKETRGQIIWLLAGFAVLGTVVIQEWLEHVIIWQTPGARAVRAAVEEGTELVGMLVLLRGCWPNLPYFQHPAPLPLRTDVGRPRSQPADPLAATARPLLLTGLAAAPLLAVVTALLPDQHRGHPADWLAAIAFLTAGLLALRPFEQPGAGARSWGAAAACLLASAASVAVGPVTTVTLGEWEVAARLLVLAVTGFAMGFSLLRAVDGAAGAVLGGGAGLLLVMTAWQLIGPGRMLPAYAGTQIMALTTLAVALALAPRPAALSAPVDGPQTA